MVKLPHLFLIVLGALVLHGCSTPGGVEKMAQGDWHFVRIDGERPLGQHAIVSFRKDRIGIAVGCNRLDGPWHVGSNRLFAGPLGQIGPDAAILPECRQTPSPADWDQSNAVGALFVSIPQVTLAGNRMILRSGGHYIELVRVAS